MKKRMLSFTLAVLLCLGLMPGTVWAAATDFTIENGVLRAYNGSGGLVVIPDGVKSINAHDSLFVNNAAITEVVIPDSVTEIKSLAFYGCANLERVTIGKGVTVITDGSFGYCPKLREVIIPDGVVTIERGAFNGCSGLQSIVIPDSVTSIGDHAFGQCSSLTSITFGKGLTSLGPVFGNCTSLTEVTIPKNIRFLNGSFGGCVNLERVVISDTTAFDQSAFTRCEKLPKKFTDAEQYYDLSKMDLSSDFRITNRVLVQYAGDKNVRSVTIPDDVDAINGGAFRDFPKLTSVDLNGVISVDPDAFVNCPALEHFINCNDTALNDRLTANEQMVAAWTSGNVQKAVTPQSNRIISLSNQICGNLTSDYAKVKAVYDWVAANITYDYDYFYKRKANVTVFPEEVLDSKLTVCDGYSRLTQALLQAQGIPAVRVVGLANIGDWEEHAWNIVYADGRWLYLDATWGSPSGGNSGRTNYNWFDTTALNFSLLHKATSSHVDANGYDSDMTPKQTNTSPETPGRKAFTDVAANAYYADAVTWAIEKGITAGTSDTTFSPESTCTTAQILTFLWRSQGQPEPKIQNPFSDVKESDYFYKAALWANTKGLVSGTVFNGNTPCTRSATVTYLWILAGSPAASHSNFTDVPQIEKYAQAVAWAVAQEITAGTSETTFSPEATCTRGQIVTFLYRAYGK